MTEISVIILTYNRKHLLPRSIESVLKQSFSNFELLLIDNGSNDGSSEICDQYAQTDKRVRAVHTGGGNIGYGRNVGLDEARGNYITFVDDDDYCEHDMLEFLYNLAVGHQADISICGSTYFFETTQTFAPKYIFDKLLLLDKEQGVFELLERKRYNNATPTKLFSKKLFDEIRFKVSGKFDDIAMTYKIFEKATKTVAYGIPKYSFAKHGNNNSGFIQSNQWMNEQLNEYIIAIEERNAYLKQRLPGLENYLRYSKWSYYLSMCDKFDAFNMNESRSVYDFMMKELENNLDEFSSYVQYHTERDMDLLKKLGGEIMMAQLNAFDMDRELLYEKVPLDTPFNVNIEPTSLCNINCKYCVHSLSTTALQRTGFTLGSMNWNVFQEAVKQMDKFPRKIKKIAFAGLGEPLLHKQLPNMIKEIKKADVAEKTLVDTNALLMTPDIVHELVSSGLDEIKISLQGITNDAYKKTCGAIIDFTNFYKTLKYLYENRGNCCIKIKIADISLDDNEREKFFDLFGNICNYISIEHIYDQFLDVTGESVLNTDHCCNRFGSELRKYSVCSLLFYRINIRWDGSVTLCCPDGLTDKNLHISKIALQDIWNGDIRRNLMKTNLTGKLRNISKCRNCKNVEYLLHQEDVLDGHEKEILQRLGC